MATCKNNHNNCEQTTTYESEYLLRNSFLTSYFSLYETPKVVGKLVARTRK